MSELTNQDDQLAMKVAESIDSPEKDHQIQEPATVEIDLAKNLKKKNRKKM